jgi:hypothetical protein
MKKPNRKRSPLPDVTVLGEFRPIAAFCGFLIAVVARVFLGMISSRFLPDTTYEEDYPLAVTVHSLHLALGCVGGFIGGYATAWLAAEWKLVHAAITALPFLLLAAGAPITPGAPEWDRFITPALPAVAALLGAWVERRFSPQDF